MMGISYPQEIQRRLLSLPRLVQPDIDPNVQDVEITTILDHVTEDFTPMDLRIEEVMVPL